ncbi:NlpC/P60 family protein [Streptomyces kunmingensis]|uniref:NlpC/P60 family protein n=2 Tax=Streptomyces kunmingensis TaxID=68225 RepID=A0ABU6CM37_9ACTN|nr:NlpC/P60 family protein [Streptomyces kunmingensis]MEB3965768.1 NlpC/P60 family protein [Streptomyces kunmingensis]
MTGGLRTTPAVGITTAALTSVALLSQTAQAAPAQPQRPSLEEVQKKVDSLYRQAEVATQKYNSAKEQTDSKKKQVDKLLDDIAQRTEKMNSARQELGRFAAQQYRTGGISDTATMFLADDPEDYFAQNRLMSRMTADQKKAVDNYQEQQLTTAKKRTEAQENLQQLTSSQTELSTSKQSVQTKLSDARELLSKLTAEEKQRLAAIEKKKEEAARKKAAELAEKQKAEEEKKRQAAEEAAQQESSGSGSSGGSSGTPSGSSSGYAAKAAKALAFAKSQEGKPYVWGATGPDSYDCSGLTQAAWKAAGITLPRTTWDQVEFGTTVSLSAIQPGDLVFFYDDISHVGLYLGDGMMIHAPKPGAYVREESIYYDGTGSIHSVVRPA